MNMKNLNNIDLATQRAGASHLAMLMGLVLNLLVFGVKLVVGLLMGSVAILADSVNNLTDALSNVIILFSIKLSVKPADRDHPFGHGRAEYLTTLILACFMMFLGFEFLRIAVAAIQVPTVLVIDRVLILVLGATVVVKLFMWGYYRHVGKRIDASTLHALAVDSRNDVLITLLTLGTVLAQQWMGWDLDGYTGLVIAGIITYSGYKLAQGVISKLLGERPDHDTAKKITRMVKKHPQILGCHDLLMHNYGPTNILASLHVDMPNDLSMDEAHTIVDELEKQAQQELGISLLLHIDPTPVDDPRMEIIRNTVLDFVKSIDKKLSAHDFKINDTGEGAFITFELVLPYEYDRDKENIITKSLLAIIKGLDTDYQVNIETEYR